MPASFNVEETLQSIPPNFEIPIIPFSELSYERALNEFFIPNIPFVVTGVTGSWSAQRNWIRSSDPAKKDARERAEGEGEADDIHVTGKTGDEEEVKQAKEPSWDYLSEEYGDLNVDVLQCPLPHEEQDNEQGEYGSGDIEEMKFDDVIKLWKEGKGKGMYIKDWHLRRLVRERNRRLHARKSFEESDNEDVLSVSEGLSSIKIEISKILKEDDKSEDGADEHKSEHDTDGHEKKEESFYTMPDIVKNDWMDNYYTNNTDDDFSFVYFGTKGTFTPLHRDVCESSLPIAFCLF